MDADIAAKAIYMQTLASDIPAMGNYKAAKAIYIQTIDADIQTIAIYIEAMDIYTVAMSGDIKTLRGYIKAIAADIETITIYIKVMAIYMQTLAANIPAMGSDSEAKAIDVVAKDNYIIAKSNYIEAKAINTATMAVNSSVINNYILTFAISTAAIFIIVTNSGAWFLIMGKKRSPVPKDRSLVWKLYGTATAEDISAEKEAVRSREVLTSEGILPKKKIRTGVDVF